VIASTAVVVAVAVRGWLSPAGLPWTVMEVGGERVAVEVALTQPSRDRGLGGRDGITPGSGMLFAFPWSGPLRFWMRDCPFDIDVAFFRADGTVTAVHTMRAAPRRTGESEAAYGARLPKYGSGEAAVGALELAAGEFARLGIVPGDRLTLPRLGSLRVR
jgi:hypothetical protein